MVFDLHPESVKTFVGDRSVRLPRFQRKITWTEPENFKLCLSLYKDYPIGVVVLKIDQEPIEKGSQTVKLLLDGRQRMNALSRMSNPEAIYSWAKSCLGLKAKLTHEEIRGLFWEYVDKYFGDIDLDVSPSAEDSLAGPPIDAAPEPVEDVPAPVAEAPTTPPAEGSIPFALTKADRTGLDQLLDLVLGVHPVRKNWSGFTQPFDFRKDLSELEWARQDSGGQDALDAQKLINWINYKRRKFEGVEGMTFPPKREDFLVWLTEGKKPLRTEAKLKETLERQWPGIERGFHLLDLLDRKLQDSKIGILELRNSTANDEKKIFEIINTGGTDLTAAEILSASPAWNQRVRDADPQLLLDKEHLYKEIGVTPEDLVRWDVAATVVQRLKAGFILG